MSDNGFFSGLSWEGVLVGALIGFLFGTSRDTQPDRAAIREHDEQQILERGRAAQLVAQQGHITPDMATAIEHARLVAERRHRRQLDADFARRIDGYRTFGGWVAFALVWYPLSVILLGIVGVFVLFTIDAFGPSIADAVIASSLGKGILLITPILFAVALHEEAKRSTTVQERQHMHRHATPDGTIVHTHAHAGRRHLHRTEPADLPTFLDAPLQG